MILAVCANPSVDSFWFLNDLEKGTTNRSEKETYYPGGKGIHAGFALNELGEEVTVLGIWGGHTGAWLKKKCEENGVATIGPAVEQWNRLCLTMKSDSDWSETELLGHGPDIAPRESEEFWSSYSHFINDDSPEAIMICGSVPAGLEQGIYHRLITCGKQQNIPTFLDASGPLLQQTFDAHPYSIHINLLEGRELSGLIDPIDIAEWLTKFCSAAAVTAGEDGLYLMTEHHSFHSYHRLDSSKIISTIGAGDCLFAGLCLASLKHKEPAHWAKFAVACGSASCIHPPLGMLKKKDAEAFVREVGLEEIKT